MSDIAITVEGLSKRYRIGARQEGYKTLREKVNDLALTPFRGARTLLGRNGRARDSGNSGTYNRQSAIRNLQSSTIWALKDVSFKVKRGEVVGIIGLNGAGKSTLLKVLARITEPTTGAVDIYGRVGSLLEVGTGFHPELTGRENIFLNGAILGMRKTEIVRKFDEIVAFAEVEKFIDTPVKHYSSGMYVRLAFAVSAHLEPEILLVDEVLAVGDARFQKKCLGKMGDVAREGRTVLFISHNMTAIQGMCTRVIWLESGSVAAEGAPRGVVTKYLKTSFSTMSQRVWDNPASAPGNEKVRLHQACVRPVDRAYSDELTVRTPLVMEFEYWNLAPGAQLSLSLVLYNDEGIALFNTLPIDEPVWHGKPFPAGLFRSACYVPGDLLNDGTYRVQLYVVQDQSVAIFRADDILVFDVLEAAEMRSGWYGKMMGAIRPLLEWRTELIEEANPSASFVATRQKS